jgi:uncharacterized protein YoaH (UPF0181 family)
MPPYAITALCQIFIQALLAQLYKLLRVGISQGTYIQLIASDLPAVLDGLDDAVLR